VVDKKEKRAFVRMFRKWRKAHLLSQRQMALVLGMSTRSIEYLEAGRTWPNASHRQAFIELVEKHQREKENQIAIRNRIA
jgi:transcriptional regulator with XRE-family HTH domain